jgi:DNA-binding PadR family transcriptional regulator
MGSGRMTKQQRRILEFLNGGGWAFGREIMKGTGLRSGTVYPALALLSTKGYVEGAREAGDPHVLGRPLRIHYRLTASGAAAIARTPQHTAAPMAKSGTR